MSPTQPSPGSTLALVCALGLLSLLGGCAAPVAGGGSGSSASASFASALAGTERHDGLLPVHVDARKGRLLLELPAPEGPDGELGRFLYLEGLRSGLGHNDVGLDRGQMGDARLVRFRRLGRRVLLEQPNMAFRADGGSVDAVRAAQESFATSVLWATQATAVSRDGRCLVDLESLLVRDAHEVAPRLSSSGQGRYSLDAGRSLVDAGAFRAFPDNLEFEALLTYAGDSPGPLVRATAPDPRSVSFVQHHSLVRLPDDGYAPRPHDPRTGSFSVAYQDTAAPLTGGVTRRLAVRHRLQRTDPTGPSSSVFEPITYYVDRGAPDAVRRALVEGASWWADAFAAAGFEDAFRVEVLPEGVDPLDARYNVIQWVHRSTRGWSYGNSIVDPRTGEIVKGHVTLGSLRVRQDRLLFEGLLGTADTGTGGPRDPLELALARIRQLSAHEVGHTLGFAHNFAASIVFNGSVMDYPAPNVSVGDDGELDLSRVYGVGVGPWDHAAVAWLYADAPYDPERARGDDGTVIPFLSDGDARPAGAAHPSANLWDNGADPVTGLEDALAVRALALERFGVDRVAEGQPLAGLEEVLATVYFHHRYQLDAAVKVLGGLEYEHALRDEREHTVRPVDEADQWRALRVLLGLLEPEALDIPEDVLRVLPPRVPGEGRNREQFAQRTAPEFDGLGAAATAARLVVDGVLQRERLARLVDHHRRDPAQPPAGQVMAALLEQTLLAPDDGAAAGASASADEARHTALRRVAFRAVVDGLIELAADRRATPEVVALATARLVEVETALPDEPEWASLRADVARLLARPAPAREPARGDPAPPPGSPIGSALDATSSSWPPADEGCSLGG